MRKQIMLAALALTLVHCGSSSDNVTTAGTAPVTQPAAPSATYLSLKRDILINADIWELQPRMIAAGLGFTDIIGVAGLDAAQTSLSEQLVRAAGGTWNRVTGLSPTLGSYTSAVTPQGVAALYGFPVYNGDGLPVEFSWPILPSSLDPTDFVVILTDGTRVTPQVCSIAPNFDFNERAVAVLFGDFGDRSSRYPVRVEVVGDLQLVGPGQRTVSALGFGVDCPGTPYTDPNAPAELRGGPRLVGAKLTRFSAAGDEAPPLFDQASPNDGRTLYGEQAQFRLRVLTSGGFSPDGVRGMYPTEFSRYFRLQAGGQLLTETGVPYTVGGGTLRIVGLAELGHAQATYDDTYVEDQDNQIDIILAGDEAAMRTITAVEVPSVPPYSPLYNPGGPGNNPTPGVRYSAASPPHTVKVLQALDDPLTVTLPPRP